MAFSFDAHKNLASSAVATAPSPATTGTSLAVTGGTGASFPTPPFNVTVWPGGGATPGPSNAEIVRVTARSTDTLTVVRGQEGTSAQGIAVGYQVALTVTAKAFTDVETAVNATLGGALSGTLPSPSLAAGAATGAALGTDVLKVGAAAGGSLAGTWPNPTLAAGASTGAALGADVATVAGVQTLTNKTLTAPVLTTPAFSAGAVGTAALAAGAVTQLGHAYGVTTSPTTTSTTLVTLPDMAVTLTTAGGDLVAILTAAVSNSAAANIVYLSLLLDGANAGPAQLLASAPSGSYGFVMTTAYHWTSVAAGSHTVTGAWATSAGTATALNMARVLIVEEVKR